MNVVFCIDNIYVIPCGVAMTSLLENNKYINIKIYIVGLNLDPKNCDSLYKIVEYYSQDIEIISLDHSYFYKYNLPLSGLASSKYITIASYVRLFLTDILPNNLDKILYLDCDLLVTGNIEELSNTTLDEYSLAGTIDQHIFLPSISEYYERLDYKSDIPYINAGVLLINLKYWRDNNIVEEFITYINESNDKIRLHDQDVINAVLHDSLLLLPLKYNMQSGFYKQNMVNLLSAKTHPYCEQIISGLTNPLIIHFSTFHTKPWFKGSLHPMQKEYFRYLAMTEWKSVPEVWATNKKSIKLKYYKRKFLYSTKLVKPMYVKIENYKR